MYEIYINGQRVGEDYFAPGFTQYNKTQLYQAYDVTGLLQKGDNAIGAQLAEGWWSGAITFQGQNGNYYGGLYKRKKRHGQKRYREMQNHKGFWA